MWENFEDDFSKLTNSIFGMGHIPDLKLFQSSIGQCKVCGLTYENFLNTGEFGCSMCYKSFSSNLRDEILPRVQRGLTYKGRAYGHRVQMPILDESLHDFNPSTESRKDDKDVQTVVEKPKRVRKVIVSNKAEEPVKKDTENDEKSTTDELLDVSDIFSCEDIKNEDFINTLTRYSKQALIDAQAEAVRIENYELAALIRDAIKVKEDV